MGANIQGGLFPNPYAGEQKMAGSYSKEIGGSRHQGERAFADQTYFSRMQGKQDQMAAYGQAFSQLAMLAAYMKQRQQPSMQGEPDPNWLGGVSPYTHVQGGIPKFGGAYDHGGMPDYQDPAFDRNRGY